MAAAFLLFVVERGEMIDVSPSAVTLLAFLCG